MHDGGARRAGTKEGRRDMGVEEWGGYGGTWGGSTAGERAGR